MVKISGSCSPWPTCQGTTKNQGVAVAMTAIVQTTAETTWGVSFFATAEWKTHGEAIGKWSTNAVFHICLNLQESTKKDRFTTSYFSRNQFFCPFGGTIADCLESKQLLIWLRENCDISFQERERESWTDRWDSWMDVRTDRWMGRHWKLL
jgi:hypothetical protein